MGKELGTEKKTLLHTVYNLHYITDPILQLHNQDQLFRLVLGW